MNTLYKTTLLFTLLLLTCAAWAQMGVLKGTVREGKTGEAIPFASIGTLDKKIGTTTDLMVTTNSCCLQVSILSHLLLWDLRLLQKR